ncbi:hypothetical protein EOK75_06925 [Pseudorhodobacter turbinis]|uniref:Uncharacterized protein n=1 Tax=Pseudorhodobacter turbinis TaxID=2500533 RepID=A0A4P8EG66_9RHOB|nr:hypothetical protein [Pseudorhodobacter turbinis]QCO55505.1 hypothetical protein EOK75_06925 [Pseudorhodobacter turbinis]
MNLVLYGVSVLIAGLLTLAQFLGIGFDVVGLLILVLLLHLPSLIPVSVARRFSGIKLGRYPEVVFPVFILLGWVAVAGLHGSIRYALIAGVTFALSVGVQLGVVRAIDMVAKGTNFVGSHNPNFEATSLLAGLKRMCFGTRAGTALLSLVVFWTFLAQGQDSFWWLPPAVLAPVLSFLAAAAMCFNLKTVAEHAASTAAKGIATSVVGNPPKCVIYYSSSKSARHVQLKPTVKEFTDAGIPAALLSREPHSVAACKAAKPDYLWRASTIDTLDAFAQPSLKAAIYINDAAKNTHFIRFNTMAHILLTKRGPVSKLKRLTHNMAVYDAIIAPNIATADLWCRTSEPEVASRVVVVDRNTATLPKAKRNIEPFSSLSLSLKPNFLAMQDTYEGVKVIRALLSWIASDQSRHLSVSIRGADKDVSVRAFQQVLENAAEASQRVTILENADTLAHTESDILIATGADDLWNFAQSEKPVLMIGSQGMTDGIGPLWGSNEEVTKSLNAASKGAYILAPTAFRRRRYNSLESVIDGVLKAKHPEGLQS